jgi:hypothetical protein
VVVVAVVSVVLALQGVDGTSPAPAVVAGQRGMSGAIRRASVTCDGCTHTARGAALVADLAVARATELDLADLDPGWTQVGPAGTASTDRPLGVIAPRAATVFTQCMHLDRAEAVDVLHDADQVLNVGSPTFANPHDGLQVDSWVDVVRTAPDGAADWSVYASPRFPSCAASLYRAVFPGDPSLTVVRFTPSTSGHRIALELTGQGPSGGPPTTVWIGLVQDGRVEATVTVVVSPETTRSVAERWVGSLTAGLLDRAQRAQRAQGSSVAG